MVPPGWSEVEAKIARSVELRGHPVGVRMVAPREQETLRGMELAQRHRYCQALMRARHGEAVYLDADAVACPAAAAAFGFRPLPPGLASGEGLVGFGIVGEPQVGRAMFESMPHLNPGAVAAVALSPLADMVHAPDVVVFEGPTEALMWVLLAYFNATGERVMGSTAVLQATCVDATVIPYLTGKANYSLGCYGCRDATDLMPDETVLGVPGNLIGPLAGALEFLARKAVPDSRAKGALEMLLRREDTPRDKRTDCAELKVGGERHDRS